MPDITHTEPHYKAGPKVRDTAPRGQTVNTTRDLRSYRIELVRLKVGPAPTMPCLPSGCAANKIEFMVEIMFLA